MAPHTAVDWEAAGEACTGAVAAAGCKPSLPPKSAKRRAAEALLQRRYSSGHLAADGGAAPAAKRQRADALPQQQQPHGRPPVCVPACSECSDGGDAAWCSQDVALPAMDWRAVLASPADERDAHAPCRQLPGGITVHVVTEVRQLEGALRALRDSMQDSCVGIDLEWRPEGWAGRGPSRVALMQLASATVAVLVRVCRLGFRMPQQLRDFLSDRDLTFVGFSWASSDEGKMRSTFGVGRHELFAQFVDLQEVAAALGYHGLGLGALTARVLGVPLPKCRKTAMSNWEGRLSAKQVQYAALDAVVAGHVFRGLRLWHSLPSACTGCHQMLGVVAPAPEWHCHDCHRDFATASALHSHSQNKQHRVSAALCGECGRMHPR